MKRELKDFNGLVVLGGVAKVEKKNDTLVVVSLNANLGRDSKEKPDWVNIAFKNREDDEPGKGLADRALKALLSTELSVETIDDVAQGTTLKGDDLRVYEILAICNVTENGEFKNYYARTLDVTKWKPKK